MASEDSSSKPLMCTCGQSRSWHPRSNGGACMGDGCRCEVFVCDHTRCGWKPRVEEPERSPHRTHFKCDSCGSEWTRTDEEAIGRPKFTSLCPCGALVPAAVPDEEPPLTPEEEEEAPEDVRCMHKTDGCRFPLTIDCAHGCRDAADALTQMDQDAQAPEDEPQPVCKFEEGCHRVVPCDPGCGAEPPPPQPARRPPYAVSYSVQGHLYEVALPGDATVKAVDGALVIQHHLGPVAGIVQVLPVINQEQG